MHRLTMTRSISSLWANALYQNETFFYIKIELSIRDIKEWNFSPLVDFKKNHRYIANITAKLWTGVGTCFIIKERKIKVAYAAFFLSTV